jgi:cytochrome c oxidase subunit 4
MAEAIVRRKVFVIVWAVLICLTVLTATVSEIDLGQWNAPVAMAIAGTKALLVALFFMHLRYEHSKIVIVWAVAGLFWLSILLLLSMTDYITRGFLNVPGR